MPKGPAVSTKLSENDDLVIGPWIGMVVGLIVGGTVATFLHPALGLELKWPAIWVPWLLAAIFGMLYGACQLRVPIRGLLAVGVFYGIFLWIFTNLFGLVLFPTFASSIRSWPGFSSFVLFSLSLSIVSVVITLMGGGRGVEEAQH